MSLFLTELLIWGLQALQRVATACGATTPASGAQSTRMCCTAAAHDPDIIASTFATHTVPGRSNAQAAPSTLNSSLPALSDGSIPSAIAFPGVSRLDTPALAGDSHAVQTNLAVDNYYREALRRGAGRLLPIGADVFIHFENDARRRRSPERTSGFATPAGQRVMFDHNGGIWARTLQESPAIHPHRVTSFAGGRFTLQASDFPC